MRGNVPRPLGAGFALLDFQVLGTKYLRDGPTCGGMVSAQNTLSSLAATPACIPAHDYSTLRCGASHSNDLFLLRIADFVPGFVGSFADSAFANCRRTLLIVMLP